MICHVICCHLHLWKHTSTNSEIIRPTKARVTAATSAREENCQRASPQIEMSLSPWLKECVNTNPRFVLRQPFVSPSSCTINRQEETHSTHSCCWPTMLLMLDLLQTTTTTGVQQITCKVTTGREKKKKKTQKKHRTNLALLDKSDWCHARLEEKQSRVEAMPGTTQVVDGWHWCRASCLHQHPLSLLIDWRWRWQRVWYPVDAGGRLSFPTTLQQNRDYTTKSVQPRPSCRNWRAHARTHARTHTRTHTPQGNHHSKPMQKSWLKVA